MPGLILLFKEDILTRPSLLVITVDHYFETGSCYVAQADLENEILLPQTPKC
jgi:hypothetical protein